MKKNILILADFHDTYSLKSMSIIINSNIFNILGIITLKRCKNKNLNILKKYQIFYSGFPHKINKIKSFIKKKNIKLCISTGFPNRVRFSFLKLFEKNIFNIHPSILPNQKGAHSTFYNIFHKEKNYGATLHLMNKKMDSGDIVDKLKKKKNILDNAEKIYHASRKLGCQLLKKNLGNINNGKFMVKKNFKTKIFKKTDIKKFDYIDIKKKYSGEHIWNLIKATNFKNHGFYIKIGGKKIKIISKIKFDKT